MNCFILDLICFFLFGSNLFHNLVRILPMIDINGRTNSKNGIFAKGLWFGRPVWNLLIFKHDCWIIIDEFKPSLLEFKDTLVVSEIMHSDLNAPLFTAFFPLMELVLIILDGATKFRSDMHRERIGIVAKNERCESIIPRQSFQRAILVLKLKGKINHRMKSVSILIYISACCYWWNFSTCILWDGFNHMFDNSETSISKLLELITQLFNFNANFFETIYAKLYFMIIFC